MYITWLQRSKERSVTMESNILIPGPVVFKGNVAENWRKYKQRFKLYLQASGKHAKPYELKIALLLNEEGN